MPNPSGFVPVSRLIPWPQQFAKPADASALDRIGVTAFNSHGLPSGRSALTATIGLIREVEFGIPGLDGFSVVFGASVQTAAAGLAAEFDVEVELGLPLAAKLLDVAVTLRMKQALLKPVHLDAGGKWALTLGSDGQPLPFEIGLTGLTVAVDSDGDFDLTFAQGAPGIVIGAFMVADSGVVVEADQPIQICLSRKSTPPAGAPPGFRGVHIPHAKIHLPGLSLGSTPVGLEFNDCLIGSGGFSGHVAANFALAGDLLGVDFVLTHVGLTFDQSIPVASDVRGTLTLPFFEQPVDVEIGIGRGGELSVGIDSSDALATLTIPQVLEIELDSVAFAAAHGLLSVTLSGKLTPTCGGLDWPSFDVKALEIDSKGNVELSGGWLDLPKQYSLDFHGFKVEITKFGYGRNDNGSKWIGFSGGVELVKGLPAGASVDGLRITADDDWSNPRFSFDGVGVELEIPGVLQFKGEVAFREIDDGNGGQIRRFDGDITLKLDAIDLKIDGTIVAGSAPGYNFFAIYVAADLPVGFPVGPSGIALYGVAGLLALQMAPDKAPEQPWYGFGPDEDGWYDEDPRGIEKLADKWTNVRDSRAFGAGVTLGTLSDNGYTFNGQVLLALVLPGPVVMLQGAANVLTERASLSDDAMFKTLAVFDKPAGNILFGVDASYKYSGPDGKLIKINGSLEAYYSFNDQSDWHLYLGKDEPRSSRIQARVLNLFDANAYFMLDSDQLAMGSWIGFDKGWQFGPLSVTLQAWMENNALISFKPLHLHGDLWVHGSVDLKVFKFGAGLSVDARIEADVFQPMHLLGDFRVAIRLPRPFKSISADVRLEWGPQPAQPPTPIVLKDVAIEHLKSSAKWSMPLGVLVMPQYDDGNGFLSTDSLPTGDLTPQAARAMLAPEFEYPVVPMDCRPSVAFGRNVWDRALVGTLPQPPTPGWEMIGDPAQNEGPARVQYSLEAVSLEKYDGAAWQAIATANGNVGGSGPLFGSWQVTTNVGGGAGPAQNKLLLWSKSGYDLYRNTGVSALAQLAGAFGDFPCLTAPEPEEVCLNFNQLSASERFRATFVHPANADVSFGLAGPGQVKPGGMFFPDLPGLFTVQQAPASTGTSQMLFPISPVALAGIWIAFAQPVSNVRIVAVSPGGGQISAWVTDAAGIRSGPYALIGGTVTLPLPDVRRVTLTSEPRASGVCLARICSLMMPNQSVLDAYADMAAHGEMAQAHWSDQGNVLEPFTDYRLLVRTGANMVATDGAFGAFLQPLQYAYFQTGGPPGIGRLSVPIANDAANFDSGLNDLSRYVRQTVPPTVPGPGQPPLSPRPVYCGYDVGVDFNENYVSLMYGLAGRDLSLLLYDANNRAVRDSAGSLAVSDNGWGVRAEMTFAATDQAWLVSLNGSNCIAPLEAAGILHDESLAAPYVELKPDTRHEARLMPSLLRETFGAYVVGTAAAEASGPSGHFGRWQVQDLGAGSPSLWRVEVVPGGGDAQRLTQHASIGPASLIGATTIPGGTFLVLGPNAAIDTADASQPAHWGDCRMSLWARTGPANVAGAGFRFSGSSGYLFTLDGPTRNLLRFDGMGTMLLGSVPTSHSANQDYHIVVEAIGASIRVSVDDTLIFDVVDTAAPSLSQGGVALFSTGGPGAAFSDLQVQDFSRNARPVYSFSFTTSPYLNFRHHLHSFNDGCWRTDAGLLSLVDLQNLALKGVTDIAAAPTAEEGLAFEVLVLDVLGSRAAQDSSRVEIYRVERAGSVVCFLVRGPQPFGFSRNELDLLQAAAETPTSIFPLQVKLERVTVNALSPDGESITLLLREPLDLSGYRIELRSPPQTLSPIMPLEDPAGTWTTIFDFPQQTASLPAGHRAVVWSCSPNAAPPSSPKSVAFFRVADGQPEVLALDLGVVDLRLVHPDGSVVHARRFLKDSDYSPLGGCTVLRKLDETAFAIFPGSGQTFGPASYRLGMNYRRDNVASDAASPILREAGDATNEHAFLDFSWTPFI